MIPSKILEELFKSEVGKVEGREKIKGFDLAYVKKRLREGVVDPMKVLPPQKVEKS